MSPLPTAPDAVFRFESPGLTVEFEGPEEWVTAQIEFFADRIRHALGESATASDASAEEPPSSRGPATGTATGTATADAPAPPTAASATASAPGPSKERAANDVPSPPPSLAEFYESARSREGRGALQERILIFAYFLHHLEGATEFSIDDLSSCFGQVGAAPPHSLANTLGIMKRNQQFFDTAGGRGRYAMTEKGRAYVQRLIGAL